MEFSDKFELDFMKRTLEIVKDYKGERDATLLLNCLLGLLVVPKERSFNKIPKEPISSLNNWGISPDSIKTFGKEFDGSDRKENLQQLVRGLRNAVAHFRISPINEKGKVKGFKFKDKYFSRRSYIKRNASFRGKTCQTFRIKLLKRKKYERSSYRISRADGCRESTERDSEKYATR